MDKSPKKPIVINTIKNKQTRERLWQQIKHKRKTEKKERREKKKKAREEFGEEAVPIEVRFGLFVNYPLQKPTTQEEHREQEDTIVTQNDDEVFNDEKDDEFEPYFSHKLTPKIMITTRPRPSRNAYFFISELMGMIPNCFLYKRGKLINQFCNVQTIILQQKCVRKPVKKALPISSLQVNMIRK